MTAKKSLYLINYTSSDGNSSNRTSGKIGNFILPTNFHWKNSLNNSMHTVHTLFRQNFLWNRQLYCFECAFVYQNKTIHAWNVNWSTILLVPVLWRCCRRGDVNSHTVSGIQKCPFKLKNRRLALVFIKMHFEFNYNFFSTWKLKENRKFIKKNSNGRYSGFTIYFFEFQLSFCSNHKHICMVFD